MTARHCGAGQLIPHEIYGQRRTKTWCTASRRQRRLVAGRLRKRRKFCRGKNKKGHSIL